MSGIDTKSVRRATGLATGAMLVVALVPRLASPIASADPGDETTTVLGTAPFSDTLTSDADEFALNSFLQTPGFENDFLFNPATHTFGDIMTFGNSFQEVFLVQPASGFPGGEVVEFLPVTNPMEFFSPDTLLGAV
ncbi:MAG: hypothetical protein WCC28_21715 [Mycobacterium sp.]|uniref:hypothetical protein n=1 Tax=Mycobacterium sp. TaxID=1785 RepID=UPI003C713E66